MYIAIEKLIFGGNENYCVFSPRHTDHRLARYKVGVHLLFTIINQPFPAPPKHSILCLMLCIECRSEGGASRERHANGPETDLCRSPLKNSNFHSHILFCFLVAAPDFRRTDKLYPSARRTHSDLHVVQGGYGQTSTVVVFNYPGWLLESSLFFSCSRRDGFFFVGVMWYFLLCDDVVVCDGWVMVWCDGIA